MHRPRNPRRLMPCRRDGAWRGGQGTRHAVAKKGNDQISDKKIVKKLVEEIVEIEIRPGFPRRFLALAERGCASPLRVRRAPMSGLLLRAVDGGARALGAVQETSVISGCRPPCMPGRVAWTGALPLFRDDFFSAVL